MDINSGYRHGYMRDCIYHCYNVAEEDSQLKNPILHHWEMTSPGYNYHFCVVHRVFHCMVTSSRIDQPCCGECAPAYYSGTPEVAWVRQNDYHFSFFSVPPSFMQMMTGGSGRGDARVYNSSADHNSDGDRGSNGDHNSNGDQPAIFLLPSDVPDHGSALEAVPRHDVTYRELGSAMMAHRRHPGLILMRFTDYDGLPGWMLCGRTMTRASFAHLVEAEHHGDRVMKAARLWACQQLGTPLPQDVRWIIWSIYMLSSKALATPLPTEKEAWMWRSWLWYWYSKVNELAVYYQMNVSSPEEDWFNRPPSNTHPVPRPSNSDAGGAAPPSQRGTPAPSDQNESMVQSFKAVEENNVDNAEDNADSGNIRNQSESPSTDLWSTESSSTETSSSGTSSSETVVHEFSISMTGLATTLASIDEDEDAEADIDQ